MLSIILLFAPNYVDCCNIINLICSGYPKSLTASLTL